MMDKRIGGYCSIRGCSQLAGHSGRCDAEAYDDVDSLRAENARLQARVEVLEKALEETFQDCYSINEFEELCKDCERHKFILTKGKEKESHRF